MFDGIARQGLQNYRKEAAELEYIGHSDKLVYKVKTCLGEMFVLSLYFPQSGIEYFNENAHFYSMQHIQAEIELLVFLSDKADLGTARPVKNLAGGYISTISVPGYAEKIAMTLYTFIDGQPMDDSAADYLAQAYAAGVAAAKLHNRSGMLPPSLVSKFPLRSAKYVQEILAKIKTGVEIGTITKEQVEKLRVGGENIISCMCALDHQASWAKGFVHTDLRVANFIMANGRAIPIDFGRGVNGYLLYDLGEMCAHMGSSDVQRQILAGYASVRRLTEFDVHCIEAFFVLFLLSVVSEFILNEDMPWLEKTIGELCDRYIPGIEGSGFFEPCVREILRKKA